MAWQYNASKHKDPITGRKAGEWCVRVDKAHRRAPRRGDSVAKVAGNGQYGFATRPDKDYVREVRQDGEVRYIKDRRTAAKPRKNGCRLVSSSAARGRDELAEYLEIKAKNTGKPRWRARKGQKPAECRKPLPKMEALGFKAV